MKILHTADWHLGKSLCEYSMLELQKEVIEQIEKIIIDEDIDVIVIAGDVYQTSMPSSAANLLFDQFITKVAIEYGKKVIVVAGNHDSAERLSYGNSFFEKLNVHLFCTPASSPNKLVLKDEYGDVVFHIWPFVSFFQLQTSFDKLSYNEAFKKMMDEYKIDPTKRNVFIGHSFYTNAGLAVTSDSERQLSVGTVDYLDVANLKDFDIAMFGHLHSPQKVAKELFRYSGSPLKYSFSEVNHHKSVVIYDVHEKNDITYQLKEIKPSLDLVQVKGLYNEILTNYKKTNDLVQVILTDSSILLNPIAALREMFPNILELKYSNISFENIKSEEPIKEKSLYEVFARYYHASTNQELTAEQDDYLKKLFTKLEDEDVN